MEEKDLEIWLSEPQTAVLETRKPQTLNMAGQGWGKSRLIGYSSGMFITDFPEIKGFIGANTDMQLTQSTLVPVFKAWAETYGYEEYDSKTNPSGAYVIDKKPPFHFKKNHKLRRYGNTISFYNGAIVFLGSLENYKAHDGKEFGWAHLDETKDTKEKALDDVIIARLRQYGLWYDRNKDLFFDDTIDEAESIRRGWTAWNPLYIHTSPAVGGVDWINKKFNLYPFAKEIKRKVLRKDKDYFFREFGNMCVVISSAYHNKHNLPPNYLANQEASLISEEKILRNVHGYPFSKSGGEFYFAFRRDWHVGKVPYLKGETVWQSWDFNVVPYMTCLCLQIEYLQRWLDPEGKKHDNPEPGSIPIDVMRLRFYKEYCLASPKNSIDSVCAEFTSDHDPLETEVYYTGDASGLSRIPGLGSYTNFGAIAEKMALYLHNSSKQVKAPNLGIFKRRDLVNQILAGVHPGVEVIIDEDCEKLIEDMENVKEGPDGKVKTKVKDEDTKKQFEAHGHTGDAFEYVVCRICKEYLKD